MLNEIFGKQARAHIYDPRWLRGKTMDDLILAGIPGVKGVMVENAFAAKGAHVEDEIDRRLDSAFVGMDDDMIACGDLHHFGNDHWHMDAEYVQDDKTSAITIEPDVIRVLSKIRGGPDMGTWVALGEIPPHIRNDGTPKAFRNAVSQAIAEKHMMRASMQTGSVVAFASSVTVTGPLTEMDLRFAASKELGVHSAPQKRPISLPWMTPRHIKVNEFYFTKDKPVYRYEPG